MKINTSYLYDTDSEIEIKEISFPFEQKVKVSTDNLSYLDFYLEDYSLDDYDYYLEIFDLEGNIYFSNNYSDYVSNIIQTNFGLIKDSNELELTMRIDCDECNNVSVAVAKSKDSNTSIVGLEDYTMVISAVNYVRNTSFYWYSILGIVIAFTLLPIAWGEKNEK
jgi:hypothetical protein